MTKLGRLVKAGKITSMEQIYLHSLPVKEYQIVDFFLPKLKDEVMKVRNTNMIFFSFLYEDTIWSIAVDTSIGVATDGSAGESALKEEGDI